MEKAALGTKDLMNQAGYKFLDLSGYMFSGKAAAIDLIREFQGYHVPYYRFEFPLIRIQDGIMDLEKALVDDWSPIRSDAAIKRFMKLVKKLANNNPRLSIKEEELIGWSYEDVYGSQFLAYSLEYAESLVDVKFRSPWPYYEMAQSASEVIQSRAVDQFASKKSGLYKIPFFLVQHMPVAPFPRIMRPFIRSLKEFSSSILKESRTASSNGTAWPENDLFIAEGNLFYEKTRLFLEKMLSIPVNDKNIHTIVMHNAFEPFNPWRPIRYFQDAKCIIVDRDPRDIYVTALTFSEGFNDKPELYSKVAGAHDIEAFIKRQQIYRSMTRYEKDPKGKVLRIRFEELVMDYERSVQKIYTFLDETDRTHIRRKEFFDPSRSGKNVGLWRDYPEQKQIKKIYSALKPYCYEG